MAIGIGQITVTDVHDGTSTQVKYSSSTSSSTPPSTGWGVSVPPPQTGHYVWKRERTSYADGTYSDWESPIRITGDAGQKGDKGDQGIDAIYVVPQNGNLFRFDDHLRSHKGISPTTESGGTLFPDGGLFGGAVGIMKRAIWLNIANNTWEDLA